MVVAPLVIDLSIMLMFLVALALCLLARPLVQALFQVASSAVGWIPWLGSKITGDLSRIEQRVTHFLGKAVTKLEARIGVVYHATARLVEEAGHQIASAFELAFALAEAIALLATWKGVLGLYHSLVGQSKATVTTVRDHTKVIHSTTKIVTHVVKVVAATEARAVAIPADVVVPGDLAGLRGKVREAENEIGRLWDRVRGISPSVVGGVAVGALAFALSRLGLGWARCSNVGKVGKNICGMNPNLLESLLAGSALVAGSISIVDLAKACQEITGACEDGVSFFVREVS